MKVSIFCPYCKRHTSLEPAPVKYRGTYDRTYTTGAIWEKAYEDIWWIGICNYCNNPVLVHNNGDKIYPIPLPSPTDNNIPEYIRKDLDEAKICFSVEAFRACTTMARRAIQSACIDKGADKNKRLELEIEELAQKNLITQDIKEWTDVVRWVGNDSAHPNSPEVLKADSEDILKLAEQFLHVLYVTPAIAKSRKSKRKK